MSLALIRWTPSRLAVAVLISTVLVVMPALVGSFRNTGRTMTPGLDIRGATSGEQAGAQAITRLQQDVRDRPNDIQAMLNLSSAYLQAVRETGDPSLYEKVEALLERSAKLSPNNPDVLATRGTLALARHDFAAALRLGQQAIALQPYTAAYYGIVGDAQIELGQYEAALATLQQMVDRRPDFASYARISHARELHGDVAGAIDLMQRAITAGGPVVEHTAWGYVQIGNLQFNRGALAAAAQNYQQARQFLEFYPPALAGQAHVLAAQGDLRQAADLLQQALDRMPLPEYAIALGDVYAGLGEHERAQRQYDLVEVLNRLFTANRVNTDMETALFFADHNIDIPASVTKARAAYAARPSIHTADALAWTLYTSGNYAEARRYSDEALRLGTRDALKIFHAGMIAYAHGDRERAREQLTSAAAINPHFSLLYADLLAKTLQELGAAPPTTGGE